MIEKGSRISEQHPADALDHLFAAALSDDVAALARVIADDAYVLSDLADGERRGREQVARALMDALHTKAVPPEASRPHQRLGNISVSTTGRTAWVVDQVDMTRDVGPGPSPQPIRFTLLLSKVAGIWRLAAGHWSSPVSNETARDLASRGELPNAVALDEDVSDGAAPFVDALGAGLADPVLIPRLYSTSDDVTALGSAAEEFFVGPQVRVAWEEFIGYGPRFAWRGGRVAALAEPDVGWMASNIDISFESPKPYRFFFIWRREAGRWRVASSHDSLPTR